MEIKITTYVDSDKLHDEKYVGFYEELLSYEKIQYTDKNKKKIEIVIDKIKESVSIEKDNSKILVGYSRTSNDYSTDYGLMKLDTQLVKLNKKSRNNLMMYEIIYNIYFNKKDKQQNKLKILLKKS